jgi:hypothetical protein
MLTSSAGVVRFRGIRVKAGIRTAAGADSPQARDPESITRALLRGLEANLPVEVKGNPAIIRSRQR